MPSGALVVLAGPGAVPPRDFLATAAQIMAADPRVASVSWAHSGLLASDGHRRPTASTFPEAAHAYAAQPAGSIIVMSPACFDLVGQPWSPDGSLHFENLQSWAVRANNRGLRHVWSAATGPGAVAATSSTL